MNRQMIFLQIILAFAIRTQRTYSIKRIVPAAQTVLTDDWA